MNRTIRRLALADIETLLDWAAIEGWNPGLDDATPFQAADPDGFFGAFVDGVMVAGISAVAYGDHFGFIGLYICHPDWRGQGHGKAVWDTAMAYLGNRTIGLDGVAERQADYARMGFEAVYETVRMSGSLAGPLASDQSRPVGQVDDISDLDRRCFPAPRPAFCGTGWPRRGGARRTQQTARSMATPHVAPAAQAPSLVRYLRGRWISARRFCWPDRARSTLMSRRARQRGWPNCRDWVSPRALSPGVCIGAPRPRWTCPPSSASPASSSARSEGKMVPPSCTAKGGHTGGQQRWVVD